MTQPKSGLSVSTVGAQCYYGAATVCQALLQALGTHW